MGIQYYAFAVVALAASGILQIFLEYLSYSNEQFVKYCIVFTQINDDYIS